MTRSTYNRAAFCAVLITLGVGIAIIAAQPENWMIVTPSFILICLGLWASLMGYGEWVKGGFTNEGAVDKSQNIDNVTPKGNSDG